MDSTILDPEFIAAHFLAVQRSLDMVREAAAERIRTDQGDWLWDRVRARDALNKYGRERLPKIRRANTRRADRHLYLERLPEYEKRRQELGIAGRAPLEWNDEPEPRWWDPESTATPSWGIQDPAWNDSGFWLTPEEDNISPILAPRPLPLYLL
ncbi:hypothetical protein DFH08DRAFT_971439 [Mycena albidolilacea]|uniref:Uncharacterized protein n=1 Tax=Mycena albidolilacea TaxID=1033008 RepID=A0AAD6ZDL9_9AGAR|nr:hypothetical protein DFH08DRAFT_971439 [Mycena albidolilacea]